MNLEYPDSFDLIEVTKVYDSPHLSREEFPFARKGRCFAVETRTSFYVFEAESVQDRKRFVFGLKLTVARLASLLLAKDTRVVEEFFEPVESEVPGIAPAFATGNRQRERVC